MNKTCVSSHRCRQEKGVPAKGIYFPSIEEINLSRQKQNHVFYLFDKSWYSPAKHVIYLH